MSDHDCDDVRVPNSAVPEPLLASTSPANVKWIENVLPALKSGYDRSGMTVGAITGVTKYSPLANDWGVWFCRGIYNPDVYDPADRERIIVAMECSKQSWFAAAVHFYWGMVEGVSFDQMVGTFLIAGGYNGIDVWTLSCTQFLKWRDLMTQTWDACQKAQLDNVPWSVALGVISYVWQYGMSNKDAITAALKPYA